jgi:hypothetical protein
LSIAWSHHESLQWQKRSCQLRCVEVVLISSFLPAFVHLPCRIPKSPSPGLERDASDTESSEPCIIGNTLIFCLEFSLFFSLASLASPLFHLDTGPGRTYIRYSFDPLLALTVGPVGPDFLTIQLQTLSRVKPKNSRVAPQGTCNFNVDVRRRLDSVIVSRESERPI